MDLWINITFGVVGVLSLIYAIWQNRSAKTARLLAPRVTKNNQQIARQITIESPDATAAAYAKSIVSIAGSLAEPYSTSLNVSQFGLTLLAPQFKSEVGQLVLTGARASWRTQVRCRADVGPFLALPVVGRYVAEFRLKRGLSSLTDHPLLYLDVFDFERRKYYCSKTILPSDLNTNWYRYPLEFDYNDLEAKLEYRVAVLTPGRRDDV